jgi:hypothetical protein
MADDSIQIDVRQLQPGLYVSLGLRWMDHPFLFNSFRLSTPEQVEKLRALGLRNIAYHPARSKVRPLPLPPEPEAQTQARTAGHEDVPGAPEGMTAAREDVPAAVAVAVAVEQPTRRTSAVKAAEPQVAPAVEAYREEIDRCEKGYRAAASTARDLMHEALVSPEQAAKKADALVEASMSSLMVNRNALLDLICGTAWDGSARYHALNVMNLSMLLGRAAGLRGEALKSLGLAALLHDIGKLLFLRVQPAGYIPVYLHAQQHNVSIEESEMLHMGISSRQMAIQFVEKKSIPTSCKNVIRWVEQPEQATEDFELVSVVAIARYMCRLCKVGFSGEINQHDLLPLEHTQLWNSIKDRVFPSFNVGNFETLVRRRLRKF